MTKRLLDMPFEFNPGAYGSNTEFTITVPKQDVENAKPIPKKYYESSWRWHQALGSSRSLGQVLEGVQRNNEGGAITLQEVDNAVQLQFGFTPLPDSAVVEDDVPLNEKWRRELKPRAEHLKGRLAIFAALQEVFDVQNQLCCDAEIPRGIRYNPARMSYGDLRFFEPDVVITHDVHDTLAAVGSNDQAQSTGTEQIEEYLRYLDPEEGRKAGLATQGGIRAHDLMDGARFGLFGCLFSTANASSLGGFSSGGDNFETYPLNDLRDEGRYFVQPGDFYHARSHNPEDCVPSDLYSMTFAAVGLANTITRERIQNTV